MVKPATSERDDPKYKGVRKRKWGKWVSEIRLPNSRERIWLGSYDSPEKAARAFDAALFCLRGRGAKLNFPNCPPDIPGSKTLTRPEIQAAAARFANEAPPGRREHCTTSSFSASQVDDDLGPIDWSFLDLLDSGEGVSDFGLYDDQVNMGGEMYPASPVAYVDDDNSNHGYGYENVGSFLWDF